jgi:hypothetical protein
VWPADGGEPYPIEHTDDNPADFAGLNEEYAR